MQAKCRNKRENTNIHFLPLAFHADETKRFEQFQFQRGHVLCFPSLLCLFPLTLLINLNLIVAQIIKEVV